MAEERWLERFCFARFLNDKQERKEEEKKKYVAFEHMLLLLSFSLPTNPFATAFCLRFDRAYAFPYHPMMDDMGKASGKFQSRLGIITRSQLTFCFPIVRLENVSKFLVHTFVSTRFSSASDHRLVLGEGSVRDSFSRLRALKRVKHAQ